MCVCVVPEAIFFLTLFKTTKKFRVQEEEIDNGSGYPPRSTYQTHDPNTLAAVVTIFFSPLLYGNLGKVFHGIFPEILHVSERPRV